MTQVTLFDALNKVAIVSVTDPRGVITDANDMFCDVSGYRRDELIGKTHRMVNSGYHPREFFAEMWRTIAAKQPWRGEVCNKAKDGALYWVDSTMIPLLDGGGNISGYFSIRYDITSRKAVEASMIQSDKMASLGQMAGGIAHEINNPIAIIEGSADRILKLIKRQPVDLAAIETFALSIIETSDRVAGIVHGLRTLSRSADADPHVPVKVAEVVEEVLALSRETLAYHGVALSVDVAPELVVVGNKTQLSQVLLNLIINADDAIRGEAELWIKVEARAVASHVEVSVTDSGKGIPIHIQDKLFLPFFTTKDPGKGTGLGLSLARKILEQHRGELVLDASGPNTRFALKLPLRDAKHDQCF